MSTSTSTTAVPDVQLIPTTKMVQIVGSNPRGQFSHTDEDFLQLKASIKERGIETPIKVGPAEVESGDEKLHPVIWGHRRHAAALELGLDVVPAIVDDSLDEKGRYLAAVSENMDRADMGPLAEARALVYMREHLGMKQTEAAKAMRMSERSARNREKILDLPEDVVALIIAGEIPLEAIPHLALVAKASPTAPTKIVELIRSGKSRHGLRIDLLGNLAHVADALGQVAAKAGLQEIHDGWGESAPGSLPVSAEQKKEIKDLHRALPKHPYSQQPGFSFGPADKKKAKAKSCLLELTYTTTWGSKTTDAYITDGDLVFELAKKKIPGLKRKIEERIKEAEARRGGNAAAAASGSGGQADADRQKQIEREERKRKREEEMAEKANRELGEALAAMPNPKASDLDVVRLVCAMALGHEEFVGEYIEEGLSRVSERYKHPDDRDLEDQVDPAGGDVKYPEEQLVEDLAAAKSPGECIKLVLQVAIAARFVQPTSGYGMPPGPRLHGSAFLTDDALDDVADRLDVLPEPGRKLVATRRTARKERAEREAKAAEEEAKAKEAEEAEQTEADDVFDVVKEFPGIPSADIAKKTKLKPNRVYRLLGDLEKAGRIKKASGKYSVVDED